MAKKAAYGTGLLIQYNKTGSYIAIANPGDITGPEMNVEQIDVTTHDSPDNFNEFVSGMADGGEVSFQIQFDPSSAAHETLYNAVATRQVHNLRLTLPGFVDTSGGGYFQFAGLLTKATPGHPVKGSLTMDMTVKVSGKPTFTKFSA